MKSLGTALLCTLLSACGVHMQAASLEALTPINCAHGALRAPPGSFVARHGLCQTPTATAFGELPTL
jgi:hypothetical protein